MKNMFKKKTSGILSDSRKILLNLLLRMAKAANILDCVKSFQIDEYPSKLATMVVLQCFKINEKFPYCLQNIIYS